MTLSGRSEAKVDFSERKVVVLHASRQVCFMRFFRLEYAYTRATLQERIGNQRGQFYVDKIGNSINNYN